MNRKPNRWTVVAIALSTQLFPVLAFGESTNSPELTLSELDQSVLNFEAVLQGNNPNNKAVLTGMIFNDCKGSLSITQSVSSSGASFRVRDPGGQFRSCMAAHKANNHSCTTETCTRLSQLANATMDLARAGDVNIQLCHEDLNRDLERLQCEDFAQPLSHESAATIARRRIEERRAERQARVDRAWQQVRNCRRDSDQLVLARSGRNLLQSLGVLSGEDRSRIDRELDTAEVRLLKRRAEHGKLDSLETVREELLAVAERRAEGQSCDDLAPIFYQIAYRYAHMREANNARNDAGTLHEGFSMAASTISEAQELSCMSDEAQLGFAGNQRDIEIDRVTALAGQGSQGNQQLFYSYWNLKRRLEADYVNSCLRAGPFQQQSNNCATAYNALGSMQRIQQRVNEADQSNAQALRALQSSIAQFQAVPQGQQVPGVASGFYGNNTNTNSGAWRF